MATGAKKLWAWLNLADFHKANAKSTERVVSRFARRNVGTQNGSVADKDELRSTSEMADRKLEELKCFLKNT